MCVCDVPEVVEFAENLFVSDVTAHVSAQWSLTHTAWEAAHMPAQIIDLGFQILTEYRII